MLKSKRNIADKAALAFAGALFLYEIGGCVASRTNSQTVTATVINKYNKWSGIGEDASDDFYVATDQGVFLNVDSSVDLKFNSADVQNKITIGKRYSFKIIGDRTPLFSRFPNIVAVSDPLKDEKKSAMPSPLQPK